MEELDIYNENKCGSYNKTAKNVLVGVMLILVGAIILGERIGIIPWWIYNVLISWQMLIIVGGVFIAPEIFDIAFEIRNLWLPAVLITIGLISIFHSRRKAHHHKEWEKRFKNSVTFSNEYVNESYIFGGGNIIVNSDNFKGGKISAIFGGGKLDLSNATLSTEGINILEVEFIFGGMEIIIPHDWNIIIETNTVFGGFSNKKNGITHSNIDLTKELRIKGTAIFGGGEIKRV
jgi:predicted membrane protein